MDNEIIIPFGGESPCHCTSAIIHHECFAEAMKRGMTKCPACRKSFEESELLSMVENKFMVKMSSLEENDASNINKAVKFSLNCVKEVSLTVQQDLLNMDAALCCSCVQQ